MDYPTPLGEPAVEEVVDILITHVSILQDFRVLILTPLFWWTIEN